MSLLLAQRYDGTVLSALAATLSDSKRVIVPDLGFFEELELLINKFAAENVCLVHFVRDGYSFDRDPRNYVDHPSVEAVTVVYDTDTITFNLGLLAYLFFELSPA